MRISTAFTYRRLTATGVGFSSIALTHALNAARPVCRETRIPSSLPRRSRSRIQGPEGAAWKAVVATIQSSSLAPMESGDPLPECHAQSAFPPRRRPIGGSRLPSRCDRGPFVPSGNRRSAKAHHLRIEQDYDAKRRPGSQRRRARVLICRTGPLCLHLQAELLRRPGRVASVGGLIFSNYRVQQTGTGLSDSTRPFNGVNSLRGSLDRFRSASLAPLNLTTPRFA